VGGGNRIYWEYIADGKMAKNTRRRKNMRRKTVGKKRRENGSRKGGDYRKPIRPNIMKIQKDKFPKKYPPKFPKKFPKKFHQKTQKKAASCHPSVTGIPKVAPESCLTSEKLQKVKNAYNSKHPNHHVLGTTDIEIYQEISNRFGDSCKEEKCWIRKLLGDNDIKPIYRPTSPADWKKNPVEWLSNFDIEAVMNQYEETYPEFEFLGPVPIDFDKRSGKGDETTCVSKDVCGFHLAEKIKQGKTKMGIVFNLSPSTSSGSHWVSLYVHLPDTLMKHNKNKPTAARGGEENVNENVNATIMGGDLETEMGGKGQSWNQNSAYCFFFDSAGESAPKQIEDLVIRLQTEWNTNSKINPGKTEMFYDSNHRTRADHQQGNTECGVYSIFFLTTILTGKCAGGGVTSDVCAISLDTEQKKVDYFQGKMKNGKGRKLMIPDKFMVELRKLYFNPHP